MIDARITPIKTDLTINCTECRQIRQRGHYYLELQTHGKKFMLLSFEGPKPCPHCGILSDEMFCFETESEAIAEAQHLEREFNSERVEFDGVQVSEAWKKGRAHSVETIILDSEESFGA